MGFTAERPGWEFGGAPPPPTKQLFSKKVKQVLGCLWFDQEKRCPALISALLFPLLLLLSISSHFAVLHTMPEPLGFY